MIYTKINLYYFHKTRFLFSDDSIIDSESFLSILKVINYFFLGDLAFFNNI